LNTFAFRQSLIITLIACACVVSACAEEEGATPAGSVYVGLYEIESWLENQDSCEVGDGTSILEAKNPLMLIEACKFSYSITYGGKTYTEIINYLRAFDCETPEKCEEQRCDEEMISGGGYIFETGNDADGWISRKVSTGFATDDEQCEGGRVIDGLLVADSDGDSPGWAKHAIQPIMTRKTSSA
jgi:hypothetical protein